MAKTIFKNILEGVLRSQPLFWINGHKDEGRSDIGAILDYHDNLRGVDCKGRINGIQFQTNEAGDSTDLLTGVIETIDGTTYLNFRDCSGNIKFQIAGTIPA